MAPLELPLTVQAIGERWAYAVSFDRTPACPSIGVAVRVYVLIESGSVSVGLLNVAATDFIVQMVLDAAPVARSVELVADRPADRLSHGAGSIRSRAPSFSSVIT